MNIITLTFSEQQLATIGAALAEMPFKIAQPVLAHIQAQLDAAKNVSEEESDETVKSDS